MACFSSPFFCENYSLLPKRLIYALTQDTYILHMLEEDKKWLFAFVGPNGQIKIHLIRCYSIGRLTIFKNGSTFLSRTIGGLLNYLIQGDIALYRRV